MANVKVIATGYEPRHHQAILHKKLKRFNVLVCHRRFGKTVFAVNEMIDQGLRCQLKNPQYCYFAPYYGQVKKIVWNYLKEYCQDIPGFVANEAELKVTIPRPAQKDKITFFLMGADNPASIRGIYLDGAILDEYAEYDPTVWGQVIRPTLSDREGWAIFIGTPKGKNHFYDVYEKGKELEDWFTEIYRASDTGVVKPSELHAAKSSMSDEDYMQEFECSFTASNVGAYYGREIEKLEKKKHISAVPYDPQLTVSTFWDLGMDDSTAIWFVQMLGKEIRVIDYLEESGKPLYWYAQELQELDYRYSEHWLPWDAAVRSLETGKNRKQSIEDAGLKNVWVADRSGVEDGINQVRLLLPRCWFDAKKCKRGIEALKAYSKKWDSKNKVFSKKPSHNWASHGADAFRNFAMSLRENNVDYEHMPHFADMDYNIFG